MYSGIIHDRMEINDDGYHTSKEKEDCVICLDDAETEWRVLECHHRYHKKCIDNWITVRPKCPMCMKSIKDNTIENQHNRLWEIDHITIRRSILFIVLIMGVIVVMVICNL